ncbi:MAG: hypothetical protein CVV47_10195, partial [Spirochaetae bacterium HGW-Spirochaetae-3]
MRDDGGFSLDSCSDTANLSMTSAGAVIASAIGTAVTPLASLTVDGGGTLTLNGNVYAELITIADPVTLGASITVGDSVDNGAVPDMNFALAVDGPFNLTLNAAGEVRFQGNVGAIGTGAGASLVQAGAGAAEFLGTVTTAQGIVQSGAGLMTFRDDVTVTGNTTASNFQNSVTLDGLTYSSAGATGFGSDATDTITISGGTVTMTGAGSITVNGITDGAVGLSLDGTG